MKYFFLSFLAVVLLVVGIFGFRGDKFSQPPIEVFSDMDDQDKIKAQKPSGFFADGMGSRKPIIGTIPNSGDNGVLPVEFSEGRDGYYFTGELDGTYGNGMPEELKLTDEAASTALLGRGKDMFGVHCAICHGDSGDGKGVVSHYFGKAGVIVVGLHTFQQGSHPDGYIYNVISNGKGNMGGYKHNLPARDRWAIVAYLRTLQAAAK
ncbi:c-type cytochrome [Akkermansiaceae bacterium]|nr:c-type cytochrome [Akkermansiaceae bacterium]MDB4289023.1 c-type cytochrome [bacterium]MDA7672324.1 c-type cytochrome [Akkermansiaceae bacterium]MDA7935139.1 c-type cytochrome [Akkermansiaceae bacterium]MDB4258067.1 c-type cytochrome [Akkermansiaceae bacterium]